MGRWGDREMASRVDNQQQQTTNNQQPTTNNQQPTTKHKSCDNTLDSLLKVRVSTTPGE